MTRFVLLSTQRSGSTWLVDMLNSHPAVTAYSELLLAGARGTPKWGATDLPVFESYRADRPGRVEDVLRRYLDDLFRERDGVQAVGFKLMYGQAGAYPSVLDYVAEHDVRVVHLVRWNFLDIVLSKDAAVVRDVFHARTDEDVPRVRVTVNAAALLQRLVEQERQVTRMCVRLEELGLDPLVLSYEDLVADVAAGTRMTLRFLGVTERDRPLVSPLAKLNAVNRRELVANYDRVEQALIGTPYASLL